MHENYNTWYILGWTFAEDKVQALQFLYSPVAPWILCIRKCSVHNYWMGRVNEWMNEWHIKLYVMIWIWGGPHKAHIFSMHPYLWDFISRLGSLQKAGPGWRKWAPGGGPLKALPAPCSIHLHSLLPAHTVWTQLVPVPTATPSPSWRTEGFLKAQTKTPGWRAGSMGKSACMEIWIQIPAPMSEAGHGCPGTHNPSAVAGRDQRIPGARWPPAELQVQREMLPQGEKAENNEVGHPRSSSGLRIFT